MVGRYHASHRPDEMWERDRWSPSGARESISIECPEQFCRDHCKQHFGEIKNKVFFKERGLLCLKGPVG